MVEPSYFRVFGGEIFESVLVQMSIIVHYLNLVLDFIGVVVHRFFVKLAIVLLVRQLPVSFSHVSLSAHDYSGRSFICRFDDDVLAGSEGGQGFSFGWGEIVSSTRGSG